MPCEGETSEASNDPSFDWMAVVSDAIKSRPRGSLQNIGTAVATGVCIRTGVCVCADMGVNVRDSIEVNCTVAIISAVGDGGTFPGNVQAVRVRHMMRLRSIVFFICYFLFIK